MKYIHFITPTKVQGVMTIDPKESIDSIKKQFPNYKFKELWTEKS